MSESQSCPWLHSDACVFVAWDLETTGPDPLQHEIVQIAAVSNRGSFTSLVRPRRGSVTPGAERVHGIGDEQLRTAPIFPDVLENFLSFISEQIRELDASHERVHLIFVGHNSWVFDDVFLTAEIVAEWGCKGWRTLLHGMKVSCEREVIFHSADTLPAARHCGAVNKKLATLLQWATGHEMAENEAHTAIGDASAVFRIAPFLSEWLKCRGFVVEATEGLLRRCRNKLKKEPSFKSKVLMNATASKLSPGIFATTVPAVTASQVSTTPARAMPLGRNSKCAACGVIYSRHFLRHRCFNKTKTPLFRC